VRHLPSSATPTTRPLHPDEVGLGPVFDTLRDALLVLDGEGMVALCNPAATRLLGISEAEALGRPLEVLLRCVAGAPLGERNSPPGEAAGAAGPRPVVAGAEAPVELRLRTSAGREVVVEATFTPIPAPEGLPRTFVVLRDVTARRRAEAENRSTFALLASTLEATGEGVLVVDEDGRIACANQRLVELWGMPGSLVASSDPAQTFGFVLRQLAEPDAFLARAAALRREPQRSSEDTLLLQDGRVVEARSHPQRLDGRVAGRVWCFRDVTAKRRAEEALRSTEEQYRTLVEGVQAVVWRGDAKTFQFTFVSKEVEALLGYPAERWTQEPGFWAGHIHPDDRAWAIAYCSKATAEGRSHVFEYRMVAADGRVVWLRDVVRVRMDDDGKPAELFGVMVDVTDRRAAEAVQSAALEALVEVDRLKATADAKEQLLRTAGHELNTPLASIRSVVHLLEEGAFGDLNGEQGQAVGMLDRNVERLIRLVRDVLEAARMQSGRLTLRPRRLDLGPLVEEVVQSMRPAAEEKGVRLEVVVGPALCVHGDPERLAQVLFNLLGNAVKFTPAGGLVAVQLALEEGEVVLRVRDTGPGLSLDEQAMLFEPFGRAPSGAAAPGHGLGLYISKGLVEEHGGRLWVESAGRGLGATFAVALPLSSPAADPGRASSRGPRESLPPA
jgi:PAS domain S-box-containing protein